MRIVLLLILFNSCVACVGDQMSRKVSSWQGSQFDELVAEWGVPDRCQQADNRRICTWMTARPTAGDRVIPGAIARCSTSFEIDASGVVIGWRWRGNQCTSVAPQVVAYSPRNRPSALDSDIANRNAKELARQP